MPEPRFHRPALPGRALFDALAVDADPATRTDTGARVARLLVQRTRSEDDAQVVERVVRLADEQGLDLLAELWRNAPPDSLAGALWRLYALRAWVHADPPRAAREFDTGRRLAPVSEVVAGSADPPGPDEVCAVVDAVLRGVVRGDLAVSLERAAAFARVVSAGRIALAEEPVGRADRLLRTAEQLEHAARLHRAGDLG